MRALWPAARWSRSVLGVAKCYVTSEVRFARIVIWEWPSVCSCRFAAINGIGARLRALLY